MFGSLVRGDFIPEISDIDMLIIFSNNATSKDIDSILNTIYLIGEKYRGFSKYEKVIDIPWLKESELPLKGSGKKSFFKFFTIYAFDFVKYSKVIYGRDIREGLEVHQPNVFFRDRIQRLKTLLTRYLEERNECMIKILAGETIRLAQLVFGELTIDKRKVLKNFLKYVPDYPLKEFAVEIWREYLSKEAKSNTSIIEKYKRFIIATLELIENVQ